MSVFELVFALCVVVCAIGHVAILHSVVRKGTTIVDAGVPRPKLLAELLWATIPILVLALVLTATWIRVRDHANPKPDMIMEVAR